MKLFCSGNAGQIRARSIVIVLVSVLTSLLTGCNVKKETEQQLALTRLIADSVYIQRGNQIVSLTFDTLRNSLLSAISSRGIDGAISFCNESAYSITATYADSVSIRRTSLRVRNSNNQPDSLEQQTLHDMAALMESSGSPTPKIVRQHGEIHFFKPILLQPMCLNCHGTPGQQIQSSTVAKIKQLYPDDQAVNYKEGDLRGVWHIIFKEQQTE